MSDYQRLRITGPVSLHREERVPVTQNPPKVILLLGLTGAGKSNFIECLANDKSLGISGNSLESVTKQVALYKLTNVGYDNPAHASPSPIYILDCPGLADTRLSEQRMITMLQEFMVGHLSGWAIYSIFYFHRITDKRLSGSQKKAFDLIAALVGPPGGTTWTGVITTMWDTLWRPEQFRDAENRFQQLKDEHFTNAFGPTADLAFRFNNTQESALHILDSIHPSWPHQSTSGPPLSGYMGTHIRIGPFASHIYESLMDRIANVQQRIRIIDSELETDQAQTILELEESLIQDRAEALNLLWALEDDCMDFESFDPALDSELPVIPVQVTTATNSRVPRPTISHRIATFFRKRFKS